MSLQLLIIGHLTRREREDLEGIVERACETERSLKRAEALKRWWRCWLAGVGCIAAYPLLPVVGLPHASAAASVAGAVFFIIGAWSLRKAVLR